MTEAEYFDGYDAGRSSVKEAISEIMKLDISESEKMILIKEYLEEIKY